jgi:copper transport protein
MSRLIVITASLALALPPAAFAHARLLRSDPFDGAVVSRAPKSVRLFFDDTVEPVAGVRAIRNGGGSVLVGKAFRPRGSTRELVVPLRPKLADGDYTVLWKALSDDGHTVEGVVAFAVGAGRAAPTPGLTAASPGPTAKAVAFRWLFLAGLLTAVGAAAFELLVLRPLRVQRAEPSALMAVGFALAAAGAAGLVPHHEATTRFGLTYQVGGIIALAGALLGLIRLVDARLGFLPALAAFALLPVPSVAGHAMDPGQPRVLSVAADVLHTGAAAVWVGGLLALALVARLPGVARRFSALALVTVGLLAATGLVRAVVELTALDQLWSIGYGRALLIKTGLLSLVIALAWRSRYRLLERFGALRRNVAAELVLLAGAVVAVAFLTDLTPGRDLPAAAARKPTPPARAQPAAPPKDAVVLAAEDGELAVALAVRPRGEVEATLIGGDGYAASGRDVTFALGSRRVGSIACGPGCYRAADPIRRPDGAVVRVLVSGSGPAFSLPSRWPAPSASTVVARTTRVYKKLRTLVIHERLASSPTQVVRTTYQLEAPDRLTYQIAGGPQAIVIGERRWDRSPGHPWQRSTQTLLPQPTPFWTGWTRAHLLGSARFRGRQVWIASFYDPAVPAWFQLWIDKRSFRTLQLRMTAAAHFMHHVYGPFDAPFRIRPPRPG